MEFKLKIFLMNGLYGELDELNVSACNTLNYTLLLDDYMRIFMLITTNEMWDKLNTYEATNEIKMQISS